MDFLVIEGHVGSRAAESARLRDALPRLDVPVDVIVVSEAQAEARSQSLEALLEDHGGGRWPVERLRPPGAAGPR